jgi:hypothetical protein
MLAARGRWRDRAAARGDQALANELTASIEALRRSPYTAPIVAAIGRATAHRLYHEQQARVNEIRQGA